MVKIKALYIKEADKLNKLKKAINNIEKTNNEIIIQPTQPKDTQKRVEKTVKKIKKICKKNSINNIVISKKLQKNNKLMQEIQKSQIQIFNGKWLFNYLAYETIEYIIQQKNKRKNQTEITLLTKDLTNQAKETINLLVKEYKRVNIVTNNIGKFKYLENKIYNDYGVMITITNNKRKSLAKAEIIVNFDFSENMINTFNIKEDAIIINIAENIKIQKKRFNGICINNYELYSTRINDEFEFNKIKNFYIRDILEENLYRKDTFANIRKDITSKHYKIKELFGNNGKVFF